MPPSQLLLIHFLICYMCCFVNCISDIRISDPSHQPTNRSSPAFSPSAPIPSPNSKSANRSTILSSFDRTLSPRQIKTRHGLLRGILITHPSAVSVSSSAKSGAQSNDSSSHPMQPSPSSSSPSLRSPLPSVISTTQSSSHPLRAVEGLLGVAYASPPLGPLRFMPPVTPSHWRGVRMASSLTPSCPQKVPRITSNMSQGRMEFLKRIKPFIENQSEDCLYLNVYAPYERGTLLH